VSISVLIISYIEIDLKSLKYLQVIPDLADLGEASRTGRAGGHTGGGGGYKAPGGVGGEGSQGDEKKLLITVGCSPDWAGKDGATAAQGIVCSCSAGWWSSGGSLCVLKGTRKRSSHHSSISVLEAPRVVYDTIMILPIL
jgi:hypothetical protein